MALVQDRMYPPALVAAAAAAVALAAVAAAAPFVFVVFRLLCHSINRS